MSLLEEIFSILLVFLFTGIAWYVRNTSCLALIFVGKRRKRLAQIMFIVLGQPVFNAAVCTPRLPCLCS